MSEQTQNAGQQQTNGRKKYNIEGYIRNVKTGQTGEGKTWMTFKLERTNGKKQVSCKAFDDKADSLIANFGEGAAVRLYGEYRNETFTGPQDNKQITFQSYKVLWSGEPKYVGTELEGQPNEAQAPAAETNKEEEPAY